MRKVEKEGRGVRENGVEEGEREGQRGRKEGL